MKTRHGALRQTLEPIMDIGKASAVVPPFSGPAERRIEYGISERNRMQCRRSAR
jgi:hypothetical protein